MGTCDDPEFLKLLEVFTAWVEETNPAWYKPESVTQPMSQWEANNLASLGMGACVFSVILVIFHFRGQNQRNVY